ncbi:hypothetical protein PR202_gb05993 [Eleusine coracana subsp. coracana]|uniref:Uncharacterized protein n=1 Tax=Eleusine coracana subsp. coracana TaxID=191504 RepID=A0AAV5E5X8_ELECO|nr:hypothetical protein PR202_gb05993 [Eleusine coracana subsp. coracana]
MRLPLPPPPEFGAPPHRAQRKVVAEESAAQAVSRLVASCANSSGVAVAVVDANAVISGGGALSTTADRPGDGAGGARRVAKFAKETGDLQTLSDVDIKIIALAYMLEAEVYGTDHLREHPPPLREVNVKNLGEAPLPGWGSNVPNLKEWEDLDEMSEAGRDINSRILPLKDLENEDIPMSETNSICETQEDSEIQPSKKDACVAWEDDENNEGWSPAVSRSTHRRYLRRKAWRDALKESGQSVEASSVAPSVEDDRVPKKTDSSAGNEAEIAAEHLHSDQVASGNGTDACTKELENLNIKSETKGGDDAHSIDDAQAIGLRLLAPGGMQIRRLHRCHACYKVTQEVGKIFCPKCGNGGTLRKVSVTVGENGITMASRRPRITLRGTKFSLPMPQGGRDSVTKNPILREDQLPQKVLHPKSKKSSKKEDDFLGVDDIFSHSGDKKAPLKPPVRKALAMFSGKRNPNDNHFSRKKH